MCFINEEGDLILDEFSRIEFSIESLIETLKSLEEQYEGYEHIKIMAFLNVTIRNLSSIHSDLRTAINEFDEYLMNDRKRRRAIKALNEENEKVLT